MVPELGELVYRERLELLSLLTMEERRGSCDVIIIFKILNQIDDVDSKQFIESCKGKTETVT